MNTTDEFDMDAEQYCNYISVGLLEKAGDDNPTQFEIDLMEKKITTLLEFARQLAKHRDDKEVSNLLQCVVSS